MFHQRIRAKRNALGLTQSDIAKAVGVSSASVTQWEQGDTSPKGVNLLALSSALGCSPDELIHGGGVSRNTNVEHRTASVTRSEMQRMYPKISSVSAGDWEEAIDVFHPGDAEDWIPASPDYGDRCFWLSVTGDSMTAFVGTSIPDGSLILVDPDIAPENGSFVVAKLLDSDEVTFKKLVIDSGTKYLKPLNPNYRMIEINGNVKIIGVVRESKNVFV